MQFVYSSRRGYGIEIKPTPGLAVIEYPNKCLHILGGVELCWIASDPGHWWRNNANVAAKNIVKALGGVSWDVQGRVSVVVRRDHAFDANDLMNRAMSVLGLHDTYYHDLRMANAMRLVLGECAVMVCPQTIGRSYVRAPEPFNPDGFKAVEGFFFKKIPTTNCDDGRPYEYKTVRKVEISYKGDGYDRVGYADGYNLSCSWTVPTEWFRKGYSCPTVDGKRLEIQWMPADQQPPPPESY